MRNRTREIMKLVEEQTGFPVKVERAQSLSTLSSVKMADGIMPFHLVYYKPFPGEQPDYAISFQCGFILRTFAVPVDERYKLMGSKSAASNVLELVLAMGDDTYRYQPEILSAFASQLYNGLMLHLYSMPIGMRVGQWLFDEYPEFRELQKAQVLREIGIARETLGEEIQSKVPLKIYEASHAINTAHAICWGERYNQPELYNPFRLAGFLKKGRELLDIWNDFPTMPDVDRTLVDRWAASLGMSNWYDWVPLQSV